MAKRKVLLTFPEELIREPIIYNLSHQYHVMTNIHRAEISDERGWVELEMEGEEEDMEQGLAWVISKGIRVDMEIE